MNFIKIKSSRNLLAGFRVLQQLQCIYCSNRASVAVRGKATATVIDKEKVARTRVIGIMAHIDAGKTTTTERMLYYSGFQQTVGEVHHGDTTMDYLDQERERGITIQSAAVTFPWRDHHISLVDTPGHVDFTMEVERCIRVVDGAVAVIDASAGVEAQTVTVWKQADRYSVPRLCYFNKMDKSSASHSHCLSDLKTRFSANPLLLQLPVGAGKEFTGVLDLMTGRKLLWAQQQNKQDCGASYTVSPTITQDDELYPAYCEARSQLCDQLGDLDSSVAEHILEHESLADVPAALLQPALRRATLAQRCVPVLLGSSFRNIGVQPLLDAVVQFLPAPLDRPPPAALLYSPSLCGLAFKILHDPQRGGLLTYVRLYTGTLDLSNRVYNVNRDCMERPTKLYVALADDYKEVTSAGPGSIVVLAGLKKTKTGDTLVTSAEHVKSAREKLLTRNRRSSRGSSSGSAKTDVDSAAEEDGSKGRGSEPWLGEQGDQHLLVGVKLPEPVFFCSIEASAPRHQKVLDEALSIMQREDPSLTVRHDHETGQLVMAGMGELHLEVVASRLQSQYRVEADLGRLQVAYREEILAEGQHSINVDKTISDTRQRVELTLCVEPAAADVSFKKLQFKHTRDNGENLSSVRPNQLATLSAGVLSALSCGPVLGCPVRGLTVSLLWLTVSRRTTDAFLAAMAGQCVRQLLQQVGCRLSEPVMLLNVSVDEEFSQHLLADLNKRRADVQDVCVRDQQKHIRALVPLSELIGYSSEVRRLSSGRATFSLELHQYRAMNEHDQREAIRRVTGFYPS